MTLDQYELCPCGSGKKIKFCCSREFLHDLDRIQRMIQGDQRLAALEKTEALLEKYPDRPSLLMTKAEIEMQLEEPAKAQATIDRLTQVDPKNPSALAMRSLLAILVEGNLNAAVNLVQDSFEAVEGVVTGRMYEAIVVLANMLLRAGLPAASKGHLQLALALSDAKDDRSAQLLMQLNHSRQIPLVLREPFSLQSCPDNVTWKIEFESAMRDVYRGRWRSGAATLSAMSARILDAPAILFNQAVVQAWLGDSVNAVKAFRQYARIRDVPIEDRVQAMAIAESMDPDASTSSIDVIQRTHELASIDALVEKCSSDPLYRQMPINQDAASDDSDPLPRAAFELLDKPTPADIKKMQASDVPEALGTLFLFGKETDRSARVTIHCPRHQTNRIEKSCEEILGAPLGQPVSENVAERASWFASNVFAAWRVPDQLPIDKRRQLLAELRRDAMLNRWPTTASPLLDGKTPTEAAEDSSSKIVLLANLLNIEVDSKDSMWEFDANALRRQLKLPERQALDAAEVDVERLPVHSFSLLNFQELTDEQLLSVYRRAYAVMAVWSLRKIAVEVIGRESLDEKIDKVEAYDILSDVASNTDEALEYLANARKLATSEGESPAAWLIDELEIRLLRGELDKFTQLLKEIQTRYIKEPGIAPSLVEVLSRYGLVTPDGRLRIPAPAAAPQESAPSAGGLWTPDGGTTPSEASPAEEPGEAKQESKLWIPGMD